jgi:hypothetical protein
MAKSAEAVKREKLQNRVAQVVWGFLLIAIGVLLTLENSGRINVARTPFPASAAVDGKADTRWSSQWSDPQWILVDLGHTTQITRVKLNWEVAYSTAYEIQVSDDAKTWTTATDVEDGKGGIVEHAVSASGRYVRVLGKKRVTGYGHSLWELEVYDASGLVSKGRPASASSTEGSNYWAVYWPLILIGMGLPALLVPKDSGNQVLGLALTVIGLYFQLQRLQLAKWTFEQVLPVILLAAGALLLSRALLGERQSTPPSEGGSC